jgi:dihydrofolate reductase/uncharacterized protein YndB with AHSA1/START domain
MRSIVNSTFVSLDSVINHMDRWHFDYVDAESTELALEQLASSDAMLMGRKTYEAYASVWPGRDDEIATIINEIPKYVVSGTLTDPAWHNTNVIAEKFLETIRDLKHETGRQILMHGYGPLAKALLGEGLLDELHLWVHPVFAGVGSGEDLLLHPGLNQALRLSDTRTLSSGVVVLSYVTGRDAAKAHVEVAAPAEDPDGFVLTRVLPGTPAAVFPHFVDPQPFARWFVVGGFTTPANRLRLDARPGGAISGVMISTDGATEVPFHARYGRLEEPHLVQFLFTDPVETVTLTLHGLGTSETQLTYRNHGSPADGRAGAIAGAAAMIDAIAKSVMAP